MLLKEQAAAYLGVSAAIFDREVRVAPVTYGDSGNIKRWDRDDLDAWIDRKKTGDRPVSAEDWLGRIGGGNGGGQNARA